MHRAQTVRTIMRSPQKLPGASTAGEKASPNRRFMVASSGDEGRSFPARDDQIKNDYSSPSSAQTVCRTEIKR